MLRYINLQHAKSKQTVSSSVVDLKICNIRNVDTSLNNFDGKKLKDGEIKLVQMSMAIKTSQNQIQVYFIDF